MPQFSVQYQFEVGTRVVLVMDPSPDKPVVWQVAGLRVFHHERGTGLRYVLRSVQQRNGYGEKITVETEASEPEITPWFVPAGPAPAAG